MRKLKIVLIVEDEMLSAEGELTPELAATYMRDVFSDLPDINVYNVSLEELNEGGRS